MLYSERNILLAPMAGVSDEIFREICLEMGASLTYTEMVSAKGLSYANAKTAHLLTLAPNEDKVCVQIFGHEPDVMASQAAWIEDHLGGHLFSIDINMGCPAKKIAGKGDGSALMRDPELASRVIRAVSKAVSSPVTVKFRRGFEMDHEIAPDFARMAEDSGAAAVAVHGRFAQQFYRGNADWDVIKRVVEAVSIPVVGNGDITSAQRAKEMIDYTGCSAIMVGRAAQGNPWIFKQIKAYLKQGIVLPKPTPAERMAVADRHALMLSKREGKIIVRMRKHAMWYLAGMKDASEFRGRCNYAKTYEDFHEIFADALAVTLADPRYTASR